MSRPIIIGASYDIRSSLHEDVRKQLRKTRKKNDRIPELALWRSPKGFVKSNLTLNNAPLLAYAVIPAVLSTDSPIAVVGDQATQDITNSIAEYFSVQDRLFAAPERYTSADELTLSNTWSKGWNALGNPSGFVFATGDRPFGSLGRDVLVQQDSGYDVVVPLQSKQELYPRFSQLSENASLLNRCFQARVRLDGVSLDVKEPNVYIIEKNAGNVINMIDDFYALRKGGADEKSTVFQIAKFVYSRAAQASTRAKLLGSTVGLLATSAYDYVREAELGVRTKSLANITNHLYGVSAKAIPAKPSLGAWFDVDSAFDFAIASKLLHERAETNYFQEEISDWAQASINHLRARNIILDPVVSAAQLNRYVTQFGEVPLVDNQGYVSKQYQEKYAQELNNLVLPNHLD